MSERNHSRTPVEQAATPAAAPSRKFAHLVAGTACLLLMGVLASQFMRANPAQSQTERPQAAAAPATTAAKAQLLGRVNNQPISFDQVAQECVARHGAEVLDSIINRMIIQQACEQQGVSVTEGEIKQEVNDIASKFNLPIDAWYQMLKAERDITPDQYHRDIIWPMLALKKLAGQEITVTEEDMRAAFQRDFGPRVEARIIFVDGNLRRANQIWEECQRDPENFDALARKYSADPNSRPLGGVVPPIRRNSMETRQIEEAAFKLQAGEISGVIQTRENNYVIIKCEGQTEPVVTDIKDVWTELHATLVEEKTQLAVAKVFEEIKGKAEVINYLTRETTIGARTGPATPPGNIRQTSAELSATSTR